MSKFGWDAKELQNKKRTMFGIAGERENGGWLWFDLADPLVLANYLKENIELNDERQFQIRKMGSAELDQLDQE